MRWFFFIFLSFSDLYDLVKHTRLFEKDNLVCTFGIIKKKCDDVCVSCEKIRFTSQYSQEYEKVCDDQF